MKVQQMGVIGLGVMGQNLALNIERNGYSVVGFDLSSEKMEKLAERFAGKKITLVGSLEALVSKLEPPRKILLMVPAGKPVDDVIGQVHPHLSRNDILIDGGNSWFKDTERRWHAMKKAGIRYIGTGVSGGEEGALWGPSIMPGGDPDAWPEVGPVLQAIAARAEDGKPCCEWLGQGGAGHFVKMVHNGIEYGDMQLICEAYFIMEQGLGLSGAEMAEVFRGWNEGDLDSYLIEITAKILDKKDDETGKPMIEVILDTAGQKGTGKWTSQSALDLGTPAPTIAEAVFARFMSAIKEQRVEAAKILTGPSRRHDEVEAKDVIDLIRSALYASKICSYAQGFDLMRAASEEHGFDLNFGEIASIWRAGCIIRARFLNRIKAAYDRKGDLTNLLLDDYFREAVDSNQESWRRVVAMAVQWGIPVPAFSSALAYYDSYRSPRLPANLLQAQRDFFGAHTFERVDRPRGQFFHHQWE
ncbi:MAG: decarboxylating NADP(+)-dependent phosphogluconate dehydrogenase [Acidobacteriota bacterium]